jgi:hypothetical protein
METHNPDDALAVYVKEVGNVEPLTKDEEAKLFRELAGHGVRDEMRATVAERRLIEGHLAQVVSIAQKPLPSRTLQKSQLATLPTTPPDALMMQSKRVWVVDVTSPLHSKPPNGEPVSASPDSFSASSCRCGVGRFLYRSRLATNR